MINKYYTPTKEEFHIGFEYEAKDYLDDQDKTIIDWIPFTIIDGDEIQAMVNETKHDSERFRVKYLDRSDIEDLGFKQLDRVNKHRYIKDNTSIWLGDVTKGMLTKIEVRDRLRAIGVTKLFIGDVKNKSALKVLLKQLNIL